MPGQFVQLQCGELTDSYTPTKPKRHDLSSVQRIHYLGEEFVGRSAFLRRPFSVADERPDKDGAYVDVIYRVLGPGTAWLSNRREGSPISLIGPLGNGFLVKSTVRRAILVAGGVGLPPLLFLAKTLAAQSIMSVCIVSARSRDQIPATIVSEPSRSGEPTPCIAEFSDSDILALVTTDDGSAGIKGLATDGLETLLRSEGISPSDSAIYTCGPEPMMKAVARIASRGAFSAQASMERVMGCGMGACQSCVIRERDPAAEADWRYTLSCMEGPAFDTERVEW
jgi:dihydroorotate dehydrogenase electron transfer subunit